ncbi:MAG: LCP family protein, partial [Acetatifactor sp.]|nr:LCP family protein [Acetatifactor sp.]
IHRGQEAILDKEVYHENRARQNARPGEMKRYEENDPYEEPDVYSEYEGNDEYNEYEEFEDEEPTETIMTRQNAGISASGQGRRSTGAGRTARKEQAAVSLGSGRSRTTQSKGSDKGRTTQPKGSGKDRTTQPKGSGKGQTTQPKGSGKGQTTQPKGSSSEQPAKKKKHRGLRRFLAVVLILFLALAGLWYVTISHLYDKVEYAPTDILADQPMKEEGVTNILLIGNDSRVNGEDGRSDAMILVSISNQTKTIYMTSLLRDIYVDIPGHEGNRLNAAYAFGGPELLLETIKQNFDIEVNRYVQVNFQAFANLIDAVGGVELELTNDEVQLVNAYLNEYNLLENRPIDTDYLPADASGLLHLNGPQALAYSRNRYIGSDFGRTERQRKVLEAVFHQLPSSVLTNLDDMIDGILPNLTTNISKSECYTLSLEVPKLLTYELVQASIPIEGSYQNVTIRKMSVLQVDFEKNKEFIRAQIYGESEE